MTTTANSARKTNVGWAGRIKQRVHQRRQGLAAVAEFFPAVDSRPT